MTDMNLLELIGSLSAVIIAICVSYLSLHKSHAVLKTDMERVKRDISEIRPLMNELRVAVARIEEGLKNGKNNKAN